MTTETATQVQDDFFLLDSLDKIMQEMDQDTTLDRDLAPASQHRLIVGDTTRFAVTTGESTDVVLTDLTNAEMRLTKLSLRVHADGTVVAGGTIMLTGERIGLLDREGNTRWFPMYRHPAPEALSVFNSSHRIIPVEIHNPPAYIEDTFKVLATTHDFVTAPAPVGRERRSTFVINSVSKGQTFDERWQSAIPLSRISLLANRYRVDAGVSVYTDSVMRGQFTGIADGIMSNLDRMMRANAGDRKTWAARLRTLTGFENLEALYIAKQARGEEFEMTDDLKARIEQSNSDPYPFKAPIIMFETGGQVVRTLRNKDADPDEQIPSRSQAMADAPGLAAEGIHFDDTDGDPFAMQGS